MSDRYYYADYVTRTVEVIYAPDRFSIVYNGTSELQKDTQRVVSNFDRDFLYKIYTNT